MKFRPKEQCVSLVKKIYHEEYRVLDMKNIHCKEHRADDQVSSLNDTLQL